jgi:ribosomal protein S18 acetylase RimI-like enzyme
MMAASARPTFARPARMGPQHRRQLADHLLALDLEDRARRFMVGASDAYIERYVSGIDFDAGFVLGAFEAGQLRGVAHAASVQERSGSVLEVGLSVARASRRRGVGRELLRACLARARQSAVGHVVVLYRPDNQAMAATALSLGATPRHDDGDVRAEFAVPARTSAAGP